MAPENCKKQLYRIVDILCRLSQVLLKNLHEALKQRRNILRAETGYIRAINLASFSSPEMLLYQLGPDFVAAASGTQTHSGAACPISSGFCRARRSAASSFFDMAALRTSSRTLASSSLASSVPKQGPVYFVPAATRIICLCRSAAESSCFESGSANESNVIITDNNKNRGNRGGLLLLVGSVGSREDRVRYRLRRRHRDCHLRKGLGPLSRPDGTLRHFEILRRTGNRPGSAVHLSGRQPCGAARNHLRKDP